MINKEQIATLKNLTICGLWPDQIVALRAAIDTLEKLPVTRDGVRVVPGEDTVWMSGHVTASGCHIDNPMNGIREHEVSSHIIPDYECDYLQSAEVGHAYSTQAAALAAQQRKDGE